MITTSFKLSESELYESLVDISKSKFVVKAFRVIGIPLLFITVLLIVFNNVIGNSFLNFRLIFPIIFSVYMVFISEISAKFQVTKLLKKKNPVIENMQISVDSNYFTLTGESFNINMSLEKLHSIIETKKFFLLKVSDGSANIIPKRALTINDVIQFKNIISTVPGLQVKLK
ncbi:YcxB family protein [Dyadobacter sp. CY345]|uniref:YcxB family protein n=1 Tax=Dyadobacter sp. CY345 TaxID=2909335 RepID=UPI001F3C88A0|nr:YcxB family protein [Dyadobacter sp. CY345]MCF2444790.1 YcxB family protein [Dyadobacter sp. CY345]